MKKILITGGSGFIGTSLLKKLLKNNYKINCLDLKKPNIIDKKLNFIKRVVLTTNDKSLLNYNYKYSLIKIKRPENLSKNNRTSARNVGAINHWLW